MGGYIGIPILIVAAILNTAVMPEFRLGGGAPDLVLMLVVSWALLADLRQAMMWAVVGGVMQDWMSVVPLGTTALGLLLVVFATQTLVGRLEPGNVLIPPLAAAAATVVVHAVVLVMLRVEGYAVPLGQGVVYVTVPSAIYNTILMLPVYRMMGTMVRWLSPRRARLG